MRKLCLFAVFLIMSVYIQPGVAFTPARLDVMKIVAPSAEGDCTLRLSFQIGKTYYWKNGSIRGVAPDNSPPMGTAPEIKNNRTFLIVRYITAEVGAKLEYWKKNTAQNPAKQDQVRITTKEGKVIDLWMGNPSAKVNGVSTMIDPTDSTGKVAPYIKGSGYTMLPLRFVGDNLGAEVRWITASSTAELIFTDQECVKKCCSYEIKPASELLMCPGEFRLADLSLKNLCTGKKVTFNLTPKSGVLSVDPATVTVDPEASVKIKAGLAMPDRISDFATFEIGVSTDCGLVEDASIKALFSTNGCQAACQWICGCITKIEADGDKTTVTFDEECDGLSQSAFTAPTKLKDLLLGLSFADYLAQNGNGACADLCVAEDGVISAWKARPNRKVCCQERILLTIELVDCEKEIAVGVDPNGIRWVLDLAGKQICATLSAGQCYDVGGNEVMPVGTGVVTSKLLKVDMATAVACTGKTVCGTIEAKNCKTDPPLLMIKTPDGQSVDLAVVDARIRSIDGKTIECSELEDGTCIMASGYEKDGSFMALQVEQMPCQCDKDLEAVDCRIASVSRNPDGELMVSAKKDCNGDPITLTSPSTLGDDFGRFKNLQTFSWVGSYATLLINNGRVIRWIARKGCVDCTPSELVTVVSSADLGQKGFLYVCRNSDGRLVALRAATDPESEKIKLSAYKGTAKLDLDALGMIKGWRSIEGSCCSAPDETIVPTKPAIIVSSQSVEVKTDVKSYASSLVSFKDADTKYGEKIGLAPYPWENLKLYGAKWISAPVGMKAGEVTFSADFCLPVCSQVSLEMLAASKTAIFLDDLKPSSQLGLAKGIAHPASISARIPAGKHNLIFVSANEPSAGLIFAMTGTESQECKTCSCQVSMLTDPSRMAVCPNQRRTYVAKITNFGDTQSMFKITPNTAGIAVNPSVLTIVNSSDDIFEVTLQMPPKSADEAFAVFSCKIEPACGEPFDWEFSVPYTDCVDCALSSDSTLIRLPKMCDGEKAKVELKIANTCSVGQYFKVTSEDAELVAPRGDVSVDANASASIMLDFTMPKRGSSNFFAGSFKITPVNGSVVCYDVLAPYKEDCCCDFEIKLQTNFIAEQTMNPGDTFTYDYLIKNTCKSKRMNFAASMGSNILKISPETFQLDPGTNQPVQVSVQMPQKTADYADFSFAVKSDCGKQINTAFRVKYTPIQVCCDYNVGILSDLPQPFMMIPGQRQTLLMGIENKCTNITLTASIAGVENVITIEPSKLTIDPGQTTRFEMSVLMPTCNDGDVINFVFRVTVDGCNMKEYKIPVVCGEPLGNCCDIDVTDIYGQLGKMALCPGDTGDATLLLTNKCTDRSISGGTIKGDGAVAVNPQSFNLEPGGSIKINIRVYMPQNAQPGEVVFYIYINIPGCSPMRVRFVVVCSKCSTTCCNFTFSQVSEFPDCVTPGQAFKLTLQICNNCENTIDFLVEGTDIQSGTISVPAGQCAEFTVRFYIRECKGSYQWQIKAKIIKPQECNGAYKILKGQARCCNG